MSELQDYRLVPADGSDAWAFQAAGVAEALALAENILPHKVVAALFENGVLLCEVRHSSGGYWHVSKPPRADL